MLIQYIEILCDGAERLTFAVYEDAKQQIKETKQYIAIITAVECVGFLLICIFILIILS